MTEHFQNEGLKSYPVLQTGDRLESLKVYDQNGQ